ncbi:MAG: LysE family transporter [Bacteroides sp.]|nr:LysE family transporter [Prevotella sp.]MCM1407128.1 LysE family transporter [Treponema brennaborense]MCM1470280.1 LysE family transporter [Bacteroides sp.]
MFVPIQILPSFLFYCYITGITPGPANLCSLSAAMQFGKRQAFKQWLGLLAGFFADAMAAVFIAFFLGTILNDYVKFLAYIGAAYLIYLAAKMLRQTYSAEGGSQKTPGFFTGLFVNLTNVKVILFCISALTSFVLPYSRNFAAVFLAGMFLPFTGPVCNLAWLFAGDFLRRFFAGHTKAVNIAMAFSLLLCAASLVFGK